MSKHILFWFLTPQEKKLLKASSTYLTLLVKECICPCALSTSAGQNLHLSIYELKGFNNYFFI